MNMIISLADKAAQHQGPVRRCLQHDCFCTQKPFISQGDSDALLMTGLAPDWPYRFADGHACLKWPDLQPQAKLSS